MATTPNRNWPTPDDTDLVRDGAAAIRALGDAIDGTVGQGFVFAGTRYYTSSGQFLKADPLGTGDIGLRAIRVTVVGAGGGGGGAAATGAGQIAAGAGGAAGGVGFKLYGPSDIASFDASEDVTVGAGGAGGAPSGSDFGGIGGASSFKSATANGGGGGVGASAGDGKFVFASDAVGGTVSAADFGVTGSPGFAPNVRDAGNFFFLSGKGASSLFGDGAIGQRTNSGFAGASGGVGSGGAGAANSVSQATTRTGGAGGAGLIIIDCFV